MLSRYLVQTRTGNLVQALHIFKYLDQHKNNEISFNLSYNHVKDPALVQSRMRSIKDTYPDEVEDWPPNSPQPRGNPVEVN